MKAAAGVVTGLIIGAGLGYGAATLYKTNLGGGSGGGGDEALLQLDGKAYRESELPSEVRSSIYEAKEEAHERINGVLNQFALQLALAKDKNKDAKADALPPFDQLLDVPAPTEGEVKALYEANKARLPPNTAFEQIKPDIERYVKNQKLSEVLKAKNDDLKAKRRLVLLAPPPTAPKVQLDLAAYPARGPANADSVLVEVADYLCPHCQATQPEVEAFVKEAGNKVRFVAVSFSLRPEGLSGALARGAFCARQQGEDAFWKYHDTAFQTAQTKGWKATDPDDKAPVNEVAAAAGLDAGKIEACLGSPEAQAFVKNASEGMHKAGVSGTPTFFVNGRKIALVGGKSFKEQIQSSLQASSSH